MKNDLISRSAAKDEILSLAVIINKPHLLSKEDTLHVLDTLPAVDAEEVFKSLPYVREALEMAKQTVAPVVRCKDCRHRDPEDRRCDHYMSGNTPFARNDNDFCSYGESRVNSAVGIDVAASIAELDFESMTRFAMQQAIKQK